jgi:drug/metabolite transporter (DMT)-like permease
LPTPDIFYDQVAGRSFGYTRLPWAVIFGALAFDDVPDVVTLIGLATVVAGGLLVAARGCRQVDEPGERE